MAKLPATPSPDVTAASEASGSGSRGTVHVAVKDQFVLQLEPSRDSFATDAECPGDESIAVAECAQLFGADGIVLATERANRSSIADALRAVHSDTSVAR
jgi:hypothetical protein